MPRITGHSGAPTKKLAADDASPTRHYRMRGTKGLMSLAASALIPNSTGHSMRPLRIGRASGSARPTSRVAPSGICPASRARACATTVAVRSMATDSSLSARRSLRRIRPVRARRHPAPAVAQHRGGLRRRRLRQVSQVPGHPAHHPGRSRPGPAWPGCASWRRSPGPAGRRPPPVGHHRPGGPACRLHPPRRPHQLAHRPGQQPRSVG